MESIDDYVFQRRDEFRNGMGGKMICYKEREQNVITLAAHRNKWIKEPIEEMEKKMEKVSSWEKEVFGRCRRFGSYALDFIQSGTAARQSHHSDIPVDRLRAQVVGGSGYAVFDDIFLWAGQSGSYGPLGKGLEYLFPKKLNEDERSEAILRRCLAGSGLKLVTAEDLRRPFSASIFDEIRARPGL